MTEQTKNFEKAAALFWALGGSIPHDSELETEAEKEVKEAGSREAVLRRAIRLCGGGNTPGERYLLANLYSWLARRWPTTERRPVWSLITPCIR